MMELSGFGMPNRMIRRFLWVRWSIPSSWPAFHWIPFAPSQNRGRVVGEGTMSGSQAPEQNSPQSLSDPWSGKDRYPDLLAPEPQGERRDDTVFGGLIDRGVSQFNWKGRRIPVVTGVGALEQAMACLEMLAQYHNVPFRKDVVQRAAQQTLGGHACSLEQLGNLATWMGFLGTIVNVSEAQLHRLPFPCFALLLDQPAMIHDISRDEVKAVVPEYGCITLPLSELLQDQAGVRVFDPCTGSR